MIFDESGESAIGLDVHCKDGEHRFLPLATADLDEEDVTVGSPLLLLEPDQLDFYRAKRPSTPFRQVSGAATLARRMGNEASTMAAARARATSALRRPHNWVQLAKFCTVGAVGYVVNLAVYTPLVGAGLHYNLAAACSFLVAVTNNYTWNRLWTFRGQRGHVGYQGLRFFVVSLLALGGERAAADRVRRRRDGQGRRAGDRDRARDAHQLRGQQALVV